MKTLTLIIALLALGWIEASPAPARERLSRQELAQEAEEEEASGIDTTVEREEPAPRPRRRKKAVVKADHDVQPGPLADASIPPSATVSAADDAVVRETRFVYLKPTIQPEKDRHERGLHLGGPRFGVTYVDGPVSKRTRENLKQMRGEDGDLKPWLAQFGWHTEYRFFRTDGGTTALLELIPLVGGLNQSLVLPSASLLFGLRTVSGLEFGAGPNANLDGASYIVAAGYSFDLGGLIIPLNAAVGFGQDRSSYTLSTGFNL